MKEQTTIINRIKRVMEYYAENNTDFAKRIGVDKSNFSKMINGQRPIGESIVNKIVLATEFRKAWLWEGEGDPLLEYEEWYKRYAKGKPNEAELVRWYKYRSDLQEDKETDKIDVKRVRQILGLTQKELADKIGVSVNTIQNYEKGGVIPVSRQQMLITLEELAMSKIKIEKIEMDERGNVIATDKEGGKYTGKAMPSAFNEEELNINDFLSALHRKDEQMDKLISLLESQQRTIENLTSQKDTAATA